MRSQTPIWIVAAILSLTLGALVGFGASGASVVAIAVVGGSIVVLIAFSIGTEADKAWLPRWIALGFIAKIAGTLARYYMVAVFYGYGDSYRYFRAGTELAMQWRHGHIPGLTGQGSLGTQVVEAVTGGLFAIVPPDLLGGFLIFAVIAFLGQILLYAAFRRFAKPHQLKPYALMIFFLPTYAFWPSSIGKDALVIFAIGASAYFVARSLEGFHLRYLIGLGICLGGIGLIRIHIAGLIVAAFVLTALVARVPTGGDPSVTLRRLLTIGAGLAGAVAVVSFFPDIFGVDLLNTQDLEGFTNDLVRRTSERGTVASGGAVTSPLDVPRALAHVLFRPYVFEASELQHYLAAIETTFVAVFGLWRLPAMIRNLKAWRSNAYVVFCTFYTIAFAIAFSVVRNLGIIARQRGQVLAFFLCVVVALGWPEKRAEAEEPPRIREQAPLPMR